MKKASTTEELRRKRALARRSVRMGASPRLDPIPDRPPCALCGEGATCLLSLTVRDLCLERDAGTRSEPYWTTSYKQEITSVEVRLCGKCVKLSVQASVVKEDRS